MQSLRVLGKKASRRIYPGASLGIASGMKRRDKPGGSPIPFFPTALSKKTDRLASRRRGVATLDYVLVLGVILPLVAFVFRVGPRIMGLAYEMVSLLVGWPFM